MKKGFAILAVLLLCVAALSGCLGKKNVLRVGTEATFPPFETTDDDENIVGFDIDIIKEIAKDNGWEIEVVHLPFDSLIESLQTDKLDIVIAAMTIDDERSEKVLFSEPYFDASQVLVIREDEDRNFGIEDIVDQNLIVAVQMGTTGSYEGEAIFGAEDHPNLKQYKRVNEAFMDLKNGRVDLVIIDEPVAKNYMAHLGGMKILGEPFTNEQYGIAVKKTNTGMMDKINASLQKMSDSGKYDQLIQKWFD
ncbi:MAG: basic amino acid ABC transporter substrate-binding protein [Eubacteriales bacterium]|nr:basic amino acid ABC transporter substrate-binding protein [Eubacteriales bacterium]MDD3073255.1 basic amino acid ABC transporter substrate-binding protein [Eubacteriales bacterium]MDD4078199.1 basic amino acid ABC transporter substrate-binding protein [Eubacteriales bacterium]MDD4768518.1 basic amino acid ABC transporter substrate-binding protein [Eubacteriales bacterium]